MTTTIINLLLLFFTPGSKDPGVKNKKVKNIAGVALVQHW